MPFPRYFLAALFFAFACSLGVAQAQSINLLPKYGFAQKSDAQLAADKQFVEKVVQHYKGDRKRAAMDVALFGWQLLRQRNFDEAMSRFNQAWLLDNSCGFALWGMGALQIRAGKAAEGLKLFAEAAQFVGDDLDFQVDHAKALGEAALLLRDQAMLKEALSRFADLHRKAPQNAVNLQNWAIILYFVESYADAWEKIKLAEATPGRNALDQKFIATLQGKMPRP